MTESQAAVSPPPVVRSLWVPHPPDRCFEAFTEEIGAWWPLTTHGIFGAESGALAFVDGQLAETAVDGRSVIWGAVTDWEPPQRLRFDWHPGEDGEVASTVEVTFSADGDGTRVNLVHDGWERFGADAMQRRATYRGPNAWGAVLDYFSGAVDLALEPVDAADLSAAYQTFFAEAAREGFGAPEPGEWSAEQVVAHVALNDLTMIAVARSIVDGAPIVFENVLCQDAAAMQRWIDDAGSFESLRRRGELTAQQAVAALARLNPDQRSTEIECRLHHDGELVGEGPRPWFTVACEIQTTQHLPGHTAQLTNLRT